MDKKIGFGFKLNKNVKAIDNLFGEVSEQASEKEKKKFIFDDQSEKNVDELQAKMGFSGFGKVKPQKDKISKQDAKQIDEDNEQQNRASIEKKARQFDLDKQIDISKEIAIERKIKLDQLKEEEGDSSKSEDVEEEESVEEDKEEIENKEIEQQENELNDEDNR